MNQAKAAINIVNQPTSMNTGNDNVLKCMYEILQSLQDASAKAGRKVWTTEELEKTTVKELLFQLATNNVRFIHVPKGYRIEIKPPAEERDN